MAGWRGSRRWSRIPGHGLAEVHTHILSLSLVPFAYIYFRRLKSESVSVGTFSLLLWSDGAFERSGDERASTRISQDEGYACEKQPWTKQA